MATGKPTGKQGGKIFYGYSQLKTLMLDRERVL